MAAEGSPPPALAELLGEVRRIQLQCDRLVSDQLAGGYRSAFRGAGIEFDEVREYVPGDDPRSVDWNVTARVGRPFVKKYVDERERSMVFLLDLSPSMESGLGVWSPRQIAARLIAILALAAVRNDDRVGLIAFGDGVEHFVPPRKGLRHALAILRDALAWRSQAAVSTPGAALALASSWLRRRATLFLLSDFFAEDWPQPLRLCRRRHDVIAVPLIAPEWRQAPAEWVRWRDPESSRTRLVDGRDPGVARAWCARFEEWEIQTNSVLKGARVDRIDIPFPATADLDAIARPLQAFFRMREARLARQ